MTELRFIVHAIIKCKCDQWITIGEQIDPRGRHYGVVHPLPQCDLFVQNGVIDYIAALRKMYADSMHESSSTCKICGATLTKTDIANGKRTCDDNKCQKTYIW